MSWWGWGERPARVDADAGRVIAGLEKRWGPLPRTAERAPKAPATDPDTVALLRDALGADVVRDDDQIRIQHAIGQSYPELHDAQRGVIARMPIAVLTPTTTDNVKAALSAAAERRLAALPYGGGTSVTSGVAGPDDPYVVLSLRGMRTLRAVDRTSLVATADAGMTGVELEAALAAHGLTLGHYPQSFERSTVGGWIATRSVGQLSTGLGAIADLVTGMRAVTPLDVVLPSQPRASEGPDLREIFLGSEGRFGVITEAYLRVRPRPESRHAEAWLCASFDAGADAIRRLLQGGIAPSLVRLSDEVETAMLGVTGGALLLTGVEGSTQEVALTRGRIASAVGPTARSLGADVATRWYETRFDAPYLRDALLERDVLADSLETATTWSQLTQLYSSVREALARALDPHGRAVVLCHISHVYAIGASLYFTFLAPGGDGAQDRWVAAKDAALRAITAHGGVISHHHGVGRDHRAAVTNRYGGYAHRVVDAIASVFDPNSVLAANRPGRARTTPADAP